MKKPSNIPASVRARLLNLARKQGRPFNEVLQYYAIERFLYRLSISRHSERFVLKGALMLQCWGEPLIRSTRDIDLLGSADNSVETLVGIFKECCRLDLPEDGIRFDPDSVQGEEITLEAHYQGVRIRLLAYLDKAHLSLQVDIGFGDVIIPGPQKLSYPTLLNFEAPRLLGYTPESSIAEKFQALVALDIANTRMKDFHDLWLLPQHQNFKGPVLAEAIKVTFARRETPLFSQAPPPLTSEFSEDPEKQKQWKAFLRKIRMPGHAPDLSEVAAAIGNFLMPPMRVLQMGKPFRMHWSPGGPWKKQK